MITELFYSHSLNMKRGLGVYTFLLLDTPPGGGGLHYMGYIGMCGPKGYGFSAVLVINRVSILADFGHKLGMVFLL